MRSKLRIILVLVASMAVAHAPAWAGKVVCRTASGHMAVEPAHHGGGGCPTAREESDAVSDGADDSCHDTAFTADLAACAKRAALGMIGLSTWIFASPVLSGIFSPTPDVPVATSHPPPGLVAQALQLSTVILLI